MTTIVLVVIVAVAAAVAISVRIEQRRRARESARAEARRRVVDALRDDIEDAEVRALWHVVDQMFDVSGPTSQKIAMALARLRAGGDAQTGEEAGITAEVEGERVVVWFLSDQYRCSRVALVGALERLQTHLTAFEAQR